MKTNIPENFVENLQPEAGNALNAEKTGIENENYNPNDARTSDTLADMSAVGVLSAPIVIENDGIWHEITLNNPYEITMDESMEITKDNTNEIIINNGNEIVIDNANRIMNDPIENNRDNISQDELDKGTIDQYLHYPNTPQRKGKKTSQKTSFILSSSSWMIRNSRNRRSLRKRKTERGKGN
ncbi:hypothetical protein JTB14_031258 [Gonioctena quinquepunctata]|nr:hypothetical protein JTB14_031258 [Gonioctena quinquepunctata]